MGTVRNFSKPLAVAFVSGALCLSAGLIYFQVTGVLPRSRQYSNLVDEAKTLGIPRTPQEILQAELGTRKNVYEPVLAVLADLKKKSGSDHFFPEPAKRADPAFRWNEKEWHLWMEMGPSIMKLSTLPEDVEFQAPFEHIWHVASNDIQTRDLSTIQAFASSFARQGKFEEARSLYRLVAKLTQWRSQHSASVYALMLMDQVKLADEVVRFYKANPNSETLKRTVVSICQIGTAPFDYRFQYWNNIQSFVYGIDGSRWQVQIPSLKYDYGRAVAWMNLPIVRQATKSDILKSYLAGYKIIRTNPTSVDSAEKACLALQAELAKANSLSSPIIFGLGLMNASPRIRSLQVRLRQIREKVL